MKKLIPLLFLIACAPAHKGHPIHVANISNYVRDIQHTNDFSTLKEWVGVLNRQSIISGSGKPTYANMRTINTICNNKVYKLNPAWPTPNEFKQDKSGDCKGFAICKYYALRKAGFKASQLNLWSGDYNGVSHMVLVAELDNKEYVLDIGAENGLPLAKDYFYNNFQPAYRFNENGWDVN